jgi:hypothetical protein
MPFRTLLILFFLLPFVATHAPDSADDLDHLAIEGSVTDLHGSVIEGATVTAREATGQWRSTVTNAAGRFRLSRLAPGVYRLKVESPGFRVATCEGLAGGAGTTIRRDFQLMPGPVEAAVTIVGTPEINSVDTTRTVFGVTLGKTDLDELPTVNRSALDLLFSLPGVLEPAFATSFLAEGDDSDRFRSAPEESGNFSLNGGTPFSNNLTIEGPRQ